MNKDTAKDYLPLVQALAEGKTIQLLDKDLGGTKWVDLESPEFAWHVSFYRIKPEPKNGWIILVLHKNEIMSIENESDEIRYGEKHPNFVRWLTDRIEYELPQGDA